MRQLEQVAFVEQSHLHLPGWDQFLDRLRTEGCDPVDPVDLTQGVDLLLGDHPPIADQNDALHATLRIFSTSQGRRIGRVAFEDRHRNGQAPFVGQKAVIDLQLAFLAVSIPEARGQRRPSK